MKFSKVTIPEGWNPDDPDAFNHWVEKIFDQEQGIPKWEAISLIVHIDVEGEYVNSIKIDVISEIIGMEGNKVDTKKLEQFVKALKD